MKKLLGFTLLLAVCLMSLPVNAQDIFTPVFQQTTCPMAAPPGYADGENLICGYVEVPELHEMPDGKTIRLSVTILKSEGDAPDPLVMFNGGPGSDILSFLPIMATNAASPITQKRDVVLMSERGSIGALPELTCPELAAVAEANFGVSLDEFNALNLEAFAACRERLIAEGVNLDAYNNPQRAADVPMVMQALGYEQYNLWGVSGGGIMSLYVLREHPEGVRTVMTDSGAFPTAYIGDVFYNIYDIVSNGYRRMFETCAADTDCNTAYPDLENVFWGLVEQLNTEPASVQVVNPQTGETLDWMLTGDVVISLLANEMTNVEILPDVIYRAANGDYTYFIERIPNLYAADAQYADALYESVVCSEISDLTQETAHKDMSYPQVLQALNAQIQFNLDLCELWDVAPVAEGEVIVSDTPILIMEGKFDSNKPPELAEIVAQNFSTSYVTVFADSAHVVFGTCALSMMGEFMENPMTAPDTSCVPDETVFAMGGTGEISFVETTLEDMQIQVQIPEGWTEVDTGIYISPLDGTILLLTTIPGENIDEAVAMFETVVGLPAFEKLGDVPVGERTWTIYQVVEGDTSSMIATAIQDGSVYIIGIQTASSQFESSADTILRPVVESVTFLE